MTNRRTTPSRTPEHIDSTDHDSMFSLSDGELDEEHANLRLTQAINYLHAKGGGDSPDTFIDRVNRIHDALVEELPRHTDNFNPRLFYRLRAMVQNAQDEHEATPQGSTHIETDESSDEDTVPLVANDTLYQTEEEDEEEDDSPSTPTPIRASPPVPVNPAAGRPKTSHKSVERERSFKYGGPNNQVEHWYRDYPPALPFAETFVMERRESMKIDSDLARSKEDFIFEADISLDHEELKPYLQLKQFESGSRFKLPHVSDLDQRIISRYGTANRLNDIINELNSGELDKQNGKEYLPSLFLEKFQVGLQDYPQIINHDDIRRSVNHSPTTVRPQRPQTPGLTRSKLTASSPANRLSGETRQTASNTNPPRPQTNANKGPRAPPKSGPAVRAIKKAVKASLQSEQKKSAPQSTPLKKPSTVSKTTITTTTILKTTPRTHSHLHATPKKPTTPSPAATNYAKSARSSTGKPTEQPLLRSPTESESTAPNNPKRKRSAGALAYTPETPLLKKSLRSAKKAKTMPPKKVDWVDLGPVGLEEDSQDPRFVVLSPVDAVAARVKAAKAGRKAAKGPSVVVQGRRALGER